MISLCTVVTERIEPYLSVLIESTLAKMKHVKEFFICRTDTEGEVKQWEDSGVHFERMNCVSKFDPHPLGLHACLDKATQPYIYLCDPDVFFYTELDELYLKLMEEHGIDYIGCSHYSSMRMNYGYFPWVGSLLMKRSALPPEDWLADKLMLESGLSGRGKFLVSSPNPEFKHNFPYPDQMFDAGSYLTMWVKENNMKWLGFQTIDCHNYLACYNRGNLNKKLALPKTKLLYHQTSSGYGWQEKLQEFLAAYEAAKDSEE